MKYLYYPGCSLKGTGKAYEESLLAVCRALEIDLQEIEDWNCCGATAYMAVDELQAHALAGRNLALAGKNAEIMAPCSACYLVLNKALHAIDENSQVKSRVETALKTAGLSIDPKIKVRHPADIFLNDIGINKIASKICAPLKGLKFAAYYGCQVVRPYAVFDDQVHPTAMDKLIEASGAETVPFPLKTKCCGGSLTGTIPEVGLRLSYIILKEAKKRGADAVVTLCPLCQFNLDGYQDQMRSRYDDISMPVLYFTQVLGLAMGLPADKLGLNRCIVSAENVLSKRR